jgi:hypothetical protein
MRQQPLGEEARRLEARFVEPPGWDRARAELGAQGTVLLHGQPGSGIRSAALRLLGLCGSGRSDPSRELLLESTGDSYADLLRPEDVEEGDRLLLDLQDNQEHMPAFQREFPGFRAAVRERNAYLAVVLPRDRLWSIEPELRSSVVPLERPDGMRVLHRNLRADGIEYQPGPQHADVEAWASRAPMRDIASLASNVRDASEHDPTASFDEWLERAWNAPAVASKVVAEIRSRRGSRLLPLMLAAAAFEGGSLDSVFEADRKLLEILEYPPGAEHELDQPDLAERLDDIDAQIGSGRRVRFVAPSHGPAVLEHFWVNYPGLRDGFRDWIIAGGGIAGLGEAERRSTARRFAEQVLHVGRPDDLTHAAAEWATSGRAWMMPPAEELLVRGLRDLHWGRPVRRQFYDWSRDAGLNPDLAYLVVALCVQEIEPDRPGEALTRLHHLYVRHNNAEVSRSAGEVLVELSRKAGFVRRVLSRLTEADRNRMLSARNHNLFLRIADPELLTHSPNRLRPLISQPVVRSQLVTCWRHVLAVRQPERYEEAIRAWLTVDADGGGSGALVDVPVEACDGVIWPLSALFAIGLRWLHEPAADNWVAARRLAAFRRLDAAINQARTAAQASFGTSE